MGHLAAFLEFAEARELGKVLSFSDIDQRRIAWAQLIAVPLFSISRIEDVIDLMGRIVASAPPASVAAH